jgi:hypothetical protein
MRWKGVFLRTGDIDQFYSMLNGIAAEGLVKIEAVARPTTMPTPSTNT